MKTHKQIMANREAQKRWRKAHPEKARLALENLVQFRLSPEGRRRDKARKNTPEYVKRNREAQLRYAYGIAVADKERMYAEQEGLCGFCGLPLPDAFKSCYDHNHETGAGRALLHRRCNLIVGNLEDKALVAKVSAYLSRHERTEKAS
jgi:hypothetical protein